MNDVYQSDEKSEEDSDTVSNQSYHPFTRLAQVKKQIKEAETMTIIEEEAELSFCDAFLSGDRQEMKKWFTVLDLTQ